MATKAEQAVEEVTKGSPVRRALVLGAGLAFAVAGLAFLLLWDIPYLPG